MKKFLEEMEKNPELKAKIEALDKDPKSTPIDFIEAAAKYGVELKEEDFKPASAQGELDENELDAVAGGYDEFECACAVGGGGPADEYNNTCGCVVGGGGMYGDASDKDGGRCACARVGGGYDY